MHLPRGFALAGLTALAVLATPVLATSAAAQVPDSRGTGVHNASLSCSGDVVRVTAVVRGVRDVGPMTISLQGRRGSGPWASTGHRSILPTTKPGRSTWTLDASGIPAAVTSLRAELTAAGAVVSTDPVPRASCAPGAEVPEVPVAALVPLTLVATGAGVLALQRRRPTAPCQVPA